jgi:hypothetical protein
MKSMLIAALTVGSLMIPISTDGITHAQGQDNSNKTNDDTETVLGMTLGIPFTTPRCAETELDVLMRGPEGPPKTCWTPSGWPKETCF